MKSWFESIDLLNIKCYSFSRIFLIKILFNYFYLRFFSLSYPSKYYFYHKGVNFIEKFKDIRVLYNVESVENDFIYVKNKNEMLKEYIYEVIPINMLNSSVNEVYKILNLYIEFLKSFDVRFKILIRNYKFNKEEYIKRHMNMCDFKNDNMELYNNYIKDLNKLC